MTPTIDPAAFERGTDAILQFLSVPQAEALVAYRGDAALRARIDELGGEVAGEGGTLTEAERARI